ncbi:UBX domain-containing protein 10 [Coemansia guatemalensis]|uniref:UBX domain-containing protein 10 n=1 Tax=Coemansia guatemalensis TaxID=2761395 RepID=A0A9W8LSW9_9FUNG|nr:UBX domain-containing protein 10 [Coemansia guatemalensis]
MTEPASFSVIDSLSDAERQRLQEFSSVTNSSDLDLAVRVLKSRQWDVQQAIQMFYEPGYIDELQRDSMDHNSSHDSSGGNSGGDGSMATTTTALPSTSSGLRRRAMDGRSNEPKPDEPHNRHEAVREPAGILSQEAERPGFALKPLFTWPFFLVLQVFMAMVRMLLSALGMQRIAAEGVPTRSIGQPQTQSFTLPPSMQDADRSVAQTVRQFEHRFGTSHPPFFGRSFASAQQAARREFKYLIPILWSKEHDDSNALGQALTHPDIVAYLSQPHFIVWLGDLASREAYTLASDMGATAFPTIGVIALTSQAYTDTGSRSASQPRLRLVARLNGLPVHTGHSTRSASDDVGPLARALIRCIDGPVERHGQVIGAARREQQEREAERRLRDQQNAAYEASLARDREREIEARAQEEKERAEREDAERQLREQQRIEELRAQWRWATLARIMREQTAHSDASTTGGSPQKGSFGTLSLRLEDGARIVQKFRADTTLRQVFDFIETREAAREWEASKTTPFGDDPHLVQPPDGYEHSYEFSLVSQFPRVIFDDKDAILGDALSAKGLWPSAALIVEPLFEPEDGSSDQSDSQHK